MPGCPPSVRGWCARYAECAEVRATCTQAVCAYVVRQKLQDAAQPGVVRCDARLRGVLGEAAVQVGSVAERLAPHLSPAPPIELTFSIKCACPIAGFASRSLFGALKWVSLQLGVRSIVMVVRS